MSISFECPGCGKSYTLRDEFAGKLAQCKKCGQQMTIPSESDSDGYGLDAPVQPGAAEPEPEPAPLPPMRWASKPEASRRPLHDEPGKEKKGFFSFGSGGSNGAMGILIAIALIGLRIYLRMDRPQNRNQNGPRVQANADWAPQNFDMRRPADTGPIPVPNNFKEPGPAREIEPGVIFREVNLGPKHNGLTPGWGGKIWVYTPAGEHATQSLPCVMIAPAGSNLVTGNDLGNANEDAVHPERIPYVKAGFAVIAYEIDGGVDDFKKATDQEANLAMSKFLRARAGLVNAHIALEYALKKLPEIDPGRISAVGHSSAGTLAVLFAEHEPRLKSCVAFAPALDLAKRFGPQAVQQLRRERLGDLATRYSPKDGMANLKCPLLLFHARDDSNVPVEDSEAFAQQANANGKSVTLDLVPGGDHYQAMIDEGIPHAIAWLNQQGAGPGR